jgi:hypothetical protein
MLLALLLLCYLILIGEDKDSFFQTTKLCSNCVDMSKKKKELLRTPNYYPNHIFKLPYPN